MRHIAPAFLMMVTSFAQAVCLNPFGCAPETRAECKQKAASAKTEAAAKAIIGECNKLPSVTRGECKSLETEWVTYIRATGGKEWEWQQKNRKFECRQLYPELFHSKAWLSKKYCLENSAQINKVAAGVNPATGNSKIMEKARADNPELAQLSDYDAVSVLHLAIYPDIPEKELALRMSLDNPPNAEVVKGVCQDLARRQAE